MVRTAALCAAFLALFLVVLSVRVVRARRTARVGLGDGGDRWLLRQTRVHANFAEYGRLALILMAPAALQGAASILVRGIGLLLVAGRMLHAFGLSREPERPHCWGLGMSLTFAALITGALANLGPVVHAW